MPQEAEETMNGSNQEQQETKEGKREERKHSPSRASFNGKMGTGADGHEEEDEMPPLEDVEPEDNAGAGDGKEKGVDDKKEKKKERSINLGEKKEEAIDEDGWLDVLDNGQLKKKVIKEGDTSGPRPERGCKVRLTLKTKLQETQEIVASESFVDQVAYVGDYDLVHGVDLAIPLMFINEVAQIVIAPRFAYGEKGREPDVPPEATLECELHLLSCEWIDEETSLTLEERLHFGGSKKERGNFWFSREEYSTAIHCYRRSIEFLDAQEEEMKVLHEEVESEEDTSELKANIRKLIDLRSTAFNNLAAAQLKTEAFEAALKSINSVLQLEEKNVKALFRKGKILAAKGELNEAIQVLRVAAKLEPETKIIQQELSRLSGKKKQEVASEKKMYQRMLQLDKKSCEARKEKSSLWKWGLLGGGFAVAVASGLLYHLYE